MQLRGADRMGTEYACVQGWGVFGQPDGPGDQRTDAQKNDATLAAMSRWNINAVRVAVNEDRIPTALPSRRRRRGGKV